MKTITIDGNGAAAHAAYAFSQIAVVYPITPSSPMAEYVDEWSHAGRHNLFEEKVVTTQMQSEAGVAGALHGALSAGALASTFTSSQGLLLMIPDLYKTAGELLPAVLHVAARTVATHALCIFGDHSDVTAVRQTGVTMLCSSSVQEAADLAIVAHLTALLTSLPVLHFFDGFRTSHEYSKIQVFDEKDGYAELKPLLKELGFHEKADEFRARALAPERPIVRGTTQNPDVFFQNRERANPYYAAVPETVKKVMNALFKYTGRAYRPFDYFGAVNAALVVVAMGSSTEVLEETIVRGNAQGKRYGLIKVRLYRPFDVSSFLAVLPKTCKKIAVLDRTKEAGSVGEPLYLDVCAALKEGGLEKLTVVGGRYGLGQKDFTPACAQAVFANLLKSNPKHPFTVGITDDVTHLSLPLPPVKRRQTEMLECKFYAFGSDGTVGANKETVKLVGANTDLFAQAYFVYDSKKSGGITVSHLRFSPKPIKAEYLVEDADFIACHLSTYAQTLDMFSSLKRGGTFLLNTDVTTTEELELLLPARARKTLYEKRAKLYLIDANAIAEKSGLRGKSSAVLQAAFFALNPTLIPYPAALRLLKDSAKKRFARKGEKTVKSNLNAIEQAEKGLRLIKLPTRWKYAETDETAPADRPENAEDFFSCVARPVLSLNGNDLPVSAFNADGSMPTDTAKREKRGVALSVPLWNPDTCIQCTLCALSCPHACIRPFLIKEDAPAPEFFRTRPALQAAGYKFRIQVSSLDCMGCGVCSEVCPVNRKTLSTAQKTSEKPDESKQAIVMTLADELPENERAGWNFSQTLSAPPPETFQKMNEIKRSQFSQPLFEFSGACAGCGETPYLKILTQLFGKRMVIANATGCSSIYGGTYPTCPYAKAPDGRGPAWANSLFEDNAEFGFGIHLAYKTRRNALKTRLKSYLKTQTDEKTLAAANAWLNTYDDGEANEPHARALLSLLQQKRDKATKALLKDGDEFIKKSVWTVGGDGWAYDIGYGGLDHVLSSGEDVNILVLDSETYSNTGGQLSKATPLGAVTKFAVGGKRTPKKELGRIFLSYGNVYVAQCALGYDPAQFIKALREAESYKGPSIVICYATCIAHGFEMKNSQAEQRKAVECGHWQVYRYDPLCRTNPNAPFTLDQKPPVSPLTDFLNGEIRFASLKVTSSDDFPVVQAQAEKHAERKTAFYKNLSD